MTWGLAFWSGDVVLAEVLLAAVTGPVLQSFGTGRFCVAELADTI